MKLTLFIGIFLITHQCRHIVQGTTHTSNAADLIKHLLRNTNHLVRPVIDRTKSVNVRFSLELIQIIELDESLQLLTCKFWGRVSWKNEFMTWNKTEWGNVKFTQLRATQVWTPDIVLYNNAASDFSGGVEKYKSAVTLFPDGTHIWMFPVTFTCSCKINVLHFPFDGQECYFKFGSWTFNRDFISLTSEDNPLATHNYIASPEWNIITLKSKTHSIVYEHYGSVPYDDITFQIKMARTSLGYMLYMIAPCFVLVTTTFFSFSLPPEGGERISVIVTNLLSFALFMNMTNDILPTNSDTITIISLFYLVLMIESAGSLFMAVCVSTVYHRGQQYCPPVVPTWLRRLFNVYVKIYNVDPNRFSSGQVKEISSMFLATVNFSLSEPTLSTLSEPTLSTLETFLKVQKEELGKETETETQLKYIHHELEFMTKKKEFTDKQNKLKNDWIILGVMLDRFYFWLFLLSVSISSIYILCSSYYESFKFSKQAMNIPKHIEYR